MGYPSGRYTMSFLNLAQPITLLSRVLPKGISEAPLDGLKYVRLNGEWVDVRSFERQLDSAETNTPMFETVLEHSLADDTNERITFRVEGFRETGDPGVASFEIKATILNVAGVSTVLGYTEVFKHSSVPDLFVRVIDNGTANCLLQIKATVDQWCWEIFTDSTKFG